MGKSRLDISPLSLGAALSALAVAYWLLPKKKVQLVTDLGDVGVVLGKEELMKDKDRRDSKRKEVFDVIIIGGGTSGCALASRLSEDSKLQVLLLDAGGSGQALRLSRIPSGFGKLLKSIHSYVLWTEPQEHAGGKRKFWPRAKMLGGCSSLNAMMAQYGAPGDFDEWAKVIGDESWSWRRFKGYFQKFERFVPHADYPDVDMAERGSSGPVKVGYFNNITAASAAFVRACVALGISYTPDFLQKARAVSRMMTYVDENYERVSSESAYLTPEVLARPNLKVAIHASVLRILFERAKSGKQRAVAVEYAKSEKEDPHVSFARKDVVLSAGAVHSPHILMLSGVGPSKHLREHDIPLIQDLPGIGQNLRDHAVCDMFFKDITNTSFKFLRPDGVREFMQLIKAGLQYRLGRGGPLASNFGECGAFVRSDDPILFPPSAFPEKLPDTTSGADSPDLEIFSTPFAFRDHGFGWFDVHTFALHCYLLRPASRGAITLKSSNPWVYPIVNPNYLQSPVDALKLVRGLRLMLRIAQTQPLASHLDRSFTRSDLDHLTHLKSDAELLEIIRDRVETVYHPCSTCRMAPLQSEVGEGEEGVVDSKLRVYGVEGLRVCDASVFPEIVSGHTAGACFAIAEKLAEDLRREYANDNDSF